MAARTITTKLALEGEAEYRAQMQKINAELRLHKSELEKVQAEYAGQLNSLEALQAKEAALGSQLEATRQKYSEQAGMLKKAQEAQEAFSVKTAALQRRLEIMAHSAEDTAQAEAELRTQLDSAAADMQRAANAVLEYQRGLNNTARDQAELETALRQTRTYLSEAETAADHCASSLDAYGRGTRRASEETESLGARLDETGDRAKAMGERSSGAMAALADALVAAGFKGHFQEIVQAIEACVDASVAFESSMAGVQKVTKMSDGELGALGEEIKQLSTEIPAAATEIAAVAESAARLGIAREDLLSFSEVMLNLGNVSDLSADAAATALARFANIAGTSAEDYERLGSTIVALGNNFATSESEITGMASRLASAGTLAGLTEAQIMALAAAMSSVGIEAEAGGTAMTQTLTAMEQAVSQGGGTLEDFARIAGMSAAEFSQAWEADAMTAIQAFIAGLGQLDTQGESTTLVLEELGLSGIRQSNMLKSLALASETLAGTVDLANQAWAENTELAAAAAARYDTTETRLSMMRNAFENVKAAVGDALTPALDRAAEAGTDAFSWVSELIENNPELVRVLAAVTAGMGTFLTAITGAAAAAKVLPPLMAAFNTAIAANPAGIAAAAIGSLAAAMAALIATEPKASAETQELTENLEANRQASEEAGTAARKEAGEVLAAADALEELAGVENKSAAQKAAMADLVERLNESVPGLSLAYDEQADSLNMTAEAIAAAAAAEAERRLRESDYEDMVKAYQDQAATARELEAAKQRLADAEERLNAMIQAGTLGVGQASAQASQAVKTAKNDVEVLTDALQGQGAAIENAEAALDGASGAAQAAAKAEKAAAKAAEELQKASENLTGSVDTLSKALKEQEKDGSLSLKTTQRLIDAGYSAALAIDEETGAVTLDRAAYIELAQAKIDEQIASLEVQRQAKTNAEALYEEATAAVHAGSAYWEMAAGRAYAEKGQDTTAVDAQIASLKRAREALGSYSGATQTAARSASSSARKIKTQAQQDLEAYKELKAELEHQKALELVTEREYYEKLKEFRDQYLTDSGNVEEYRKVTEQIFKYDKALVDKEAALWEEQTGNLVEELEDRVDAVQKQQQSMESALAGYGELFTVKDGQMNLENIQEDLDALEAYSQALTALRDRGVSGSLLDEVLGMDVEEATAYSEKLLAMSDPQWEEYNTLWETKQRRAAEIAEQFFKEEMDAIETEYDARLAEAMEGLEETAFASGADTAQGLIDGMASREAAVRAQAQALADAMDQVLAKARRVPSNAEVASWLNDADIREPQPVTARDVRNVGSAVVNGMQTAAMTASAGGQSGAGDVYLDSQKVGRILLPTLRAEDRANPEVKDDR